MKKVLLSAAIAIFATGCETKNVSIQSTDTMISGMSIKTYTIQGCEYIGKAIGGDSAVLTHKGNCKFCIERNKTIK